MGFAGRKRTHFNAFGGLPGAVFKSAFENRARAALKQRFGGSGTRTKTGRRGRETGFTTQYNDSHMLYKFRRAPRRLARRVRKFARGVRRVMSNEVAMQVLVRSYYQTGATTASTQAVMTNAGMYSCLGSSSAGCNDVSELFYSYGGRANPNWDQILVTKGAVLNYTLWAATANAYDMYADAYYCCARRDIPSALSNNFTGLANQCFSNVGAPASGNQLALSQLGVTPFDNSEFCRLVKISKVRRYKMAPGDSVSIQIRDPREYRWSAAQYGALAGGGSVNEQLLARKGVTEWVMFIIYGAPNGAYSAPVVNWAITTNRNYHYVAEEKTLALGDYV